MERLHTATRIALGVNVCWLFACLLIWSGLHSSSEAIGEHDPEKLQNSLRTVGVGFLILVVGFVALLGAIVRGLQAMRALDRGRSQFEKGHQNSVSAGILLLAFAFFLLAIPFTSAFSAALQAAGFYSQGASSSAAGAYPSTGTDLFGLALLDFFATIVMGAAMLCFVHYLLHPGVRRLEGLFMVLSILSSLVSLLMGLAVPSMIGSYSGPDAPIAQARNALDVAAAVIAVSGLGCFLSICALWTYSFLVDVAADRLAARMASNKGATSQPPP